jgi:hypothetical protein
VSRGRQGSIENHPNKAQIDALLATEIPLKDIAAQIPDLSVHALSRYKRKNLLPPVANGTGDSLEAQAAMWRERADHLWHQATIDQDSRAMAQAVAAGLRSVELQARQEKNEEAKPETGDEKPLTIAALDEILRNAPPPIESVERVRVLLDDIPRRDRDRIGQLIEQMLCVEGYGCKGYTPQRQEK